MIEKQVIFKGIVQGVFFRKTVSNHAKQHQVTGIVKNLSDGSVEMIVQGDETEIERLLTAIAENHMPARIDEIQKNDRTPTQKYMDFQIEF